MSFFSRNLIVRRRDAHRDVTETAAIMPEQAAMLGQQEYLGVVVSRRRLLVGICLLFVALGILWARAASLQILSGDEGRIRAERNRVRLVRLAAVRGVFFDRFGIPLVANVPHFAVRVIPAEFPTDPEAQALVWAKISSVTHVPAQQLADTFAQRETPPQIPVPLVDRVVYDQALRLMIVQGDLPGVDIAVDTVRTYNVGSTVHASWAHIFGYVGNVTAELLETLPKDDYLPNDRIGRAGIESSLEPIVRGKTGIKQVEVDAMGREKNIIAETPPVDGESVQLAIDKEAQEKLEELLQGTLNRLGKKRAAAVAIDPRNGGVRALVSLPGYDANTFTFGVASTTYRALVSDPDHPLYPRAVAGVYPSGSIIKPIIAAAALEEHVITPQTTFLSTGGIHVGEWFFPDWKAGGHGRIDVRTAIADSVNTFFYLVGGGSETVTGLGIDRIARYMRAFGLGTRTGIELPGESDGLVPTPDWKQKTMNEAWFIGDTYHTAIGQGDVLVTPLQMATVMQAFANGGVVYRPRLVEARRKTDGTVTAAPIEVLREHMVSPETLQVVREGMRQTVTNGSAGSLQSVPVPVAGKTGTAQWKEGALPHAWFVGFAPYDRPELLIVILLEDSGEGSSVAVPVAREFLSWYFGRPAVQAP